MNMIDAARDTLRLAEEQGFGTSGGIYTSADGTDFEHLRYMVAELEANALTWSDAKIGRWLGWMQGSLVANGIGDLETMKQINTRHAE